MDPYSCDTQTSTSLLRYSSISKLFGLANLSTVIKDTLDNDYVIQQLKDSNTASSFNIDGTVTNALATQFLRNYADVNTTYSFVKSVEQTYIVEAIIGTIIQDVLAVDPSTNEIVSVLISDEYSKSKKASKEVEKFLENLSIDALLQSSAFEALFYGEKLFEISGDEKNGITDVVDANPAGTVIPVYDGETPRYYLRIQKNVFNSTELESLSPGRMWHISLFPSKKRLQLHSTSFENDQISHYYRTANPMFRNVVDKIVELESFEKAQLVRSLGDIKRNSMVEVQAPAGLTLPELKDFSKWYETKLNGNSKLDGSLDSMNAYVASLADIKVIPKQPDRGGISKVDVSSKASRDTKQSPEIEDRRQIICQVIGVPYEYVFGRGNTKVDSRQYVRYSRLCTTIQYGFARSIKQLIKTQLYNVGLKDIKLDHIKVNFYNSTNIAELDRLEFLDASVSMVTSFNRFINDLSRDSETKKYINQDERMRFFKKVFSSTDGAENIINVGDPNESKDMNESKNEEYTNDVSSIQLLSSITRYFSTAEDKYKPLWLDSLTREYPEVDPSIMIHLKEELERLGEI